MPVAAGAIHPSTQEVLESFRRRYGESDLPAISVVELLRRIERQETLPHECLLVEGFHWLWEVIPDEETLRREVQTVLRRRMNWLQNRQYSVYFTLPADVTFLPGENLSLRLASGRYVDLTRLFGPLVRVSADHYHKPFNIDS